MVVSSLPSPYKEWSLEDRDLMAVKDVLVLLLGLGIIGLDEYLEVLIELDTSVSVGALSTRDIVEGVMVFTMDETDYD